MNKLNYIDIVSYKSEYKVNLFIFVFVESIFCFILGIG